MIDYKPSRGHRLNLFGLEAAARRPYDPQQQRPVAHDRDAEHPADFDRRHRHLEKVAHRLDLARDQEREQPGLPARRTGGDAGEADLVVLVGAGEMRLTLEQAVVGDPDRYQDLSILVQPEPL